MRIHNNGGSLCENQMSTFSKGFVFGGQFIRIRADCQVSFYLILIIRKKIIAKDYRAKNLINHLAT